MKILGIDFGLKKIGLAIADGILADPYSVIRYELEAYAIRKICEVIDKEEIEKIVVGISEGESARKTMKFINEFKKTTSVPIEFQDETLSTREAQAFALESNISRKKRKGMEDAYAAAVILQAYLDQNR